MLLPSPSLANGPGVTAPAYELKFLVPLELAAQIETWARERLSPDPHGDPALRGQYQTTTLYLDTARRDVFLRAAGFRCRKYRLRRYGSDGRNGVLFAERKVRRGDRVRKQRVELPAPALLVLADRGAAPPPAAGWFCREISQRALAPAALVTYLRTAFVGAAAGALMRLTLDRAIRGRTTAGWELAAVDGGTAFLADVAICELKFHAALPPLFRSLVGEFRLAPSPVSKYRRLMEATGAGNGRDA